ncbi:MAG: ATP-binding protein [Deltaproteobacteria bacterium]|nr:ATP-binding protein [Deltaproteobacteria bacterium]
MSNALLTELETAAAQAVSERAAVKLAVSAPEGMGRTTLLQAFADRLHAQQRPAFVVPGHDAPAALLRALRPEATTLDAILGAPELAELDGERKLLAAELLAELVIPDLSRTATAALDDAGRREAAFVELARWLALHSGTGPLLLAFDDVHLADADSLAFIDYLAHLEERLPLVLLLSLDAAPEHAAPAFAAGWPAMREGFRALELGPLENDALEALLTARGASTADATRLVTVSRGNPGLALALLADPSAASFDALRLANVRALGEPAARLAQALAILGGEAPLDALGDVAPMDALERAGVVTRRDTTALLNDTRLRASLAKSVDDAQAKAWRLSAGAWAARTLEALAPSEFAARAEELVPLAAPAMSGPARSMWLEALADVRAGEGRRSALEQAVQDAVGVRKVVLLRRLADAQIFAGQPDAALRTLEPLGHTSPAPTPLPPGTAGAMLRARPRPLVDQWDALSPDAALAAVELGRAEALSHLVRRDDTIRAFEEAHHRLVRLEGPAAAQLWVRWAKTWAWFASEILGRPQQALEICGEVRRRVPAKDLQDDALMLHLLRAEVMASSGSGDFDRARTLAEQLVALTQRLGEKREECLAWNARAILHFGMGELAQAKKAFERSRDLGRTTGWLRREAIATHNLALVLTELGELERARASETLYGKLSVTIGNHAGKAEAPAVLAHVAIARGALAEADAFIVTARKHAEANGWAMLLAQTRALSGKSRLLRFAKTRDRLDLGRARSELLAALDELEERSTAWVEELDPGEIYALTAAALRLAGQDAAARETLERGAAKIPPQNVVSHQALAVGRAFVAREGLQQALGWFEARGYARVLAQWKALSQLA